MLHNNTHLWIYRYPDMFYGGIDKELYVTSVGIRGIRNTGLYSILFQPSAVTLKCCISYSITV